MASYTLNMPALPTAGMRQIGMKILVPLVCRFTYWFTCRRHGGTEAGSPTGGTEVGSPTGGTEVGSPTGGTEVGSPTGGTEVGGMKYISLCTERFIFESPPQSISFPFTATM